VKKKCYPCSLYYTFESTKIMLGNLDNGTIFKKAFTDKLVFEQFVKDILGIEVHVSTIETEKQFSPKIGRIAFELDIFAETDDKRMVIELQKIEYDYGLDRFLHYFLMLLAEQQASAKQNKINRTVYLILIMTQPYNLLKDLDGNPMQEEMLVTYFHTENSGKSNLPLYAHQFIALNPNHKHKDTPKEVRDWLDLIYESINNPENPNINRQNPGIDKAADLIDMNKLTPIELEAKKKDEAAKTTKKMYEQAAAEKAKREEKERLVKNFFRSGASLELIASATNLAIEEVKQILENE
jgi:predicted transposase/invertase (TIGR01784 family)